MEQSKKLIYLSIIILLAIITIIVESLCFYKKEIGQAPPTGTALFPSDPFLKWLVSVVDWGFGEYPNYITILIYSSILN